MSMNVPQWLLDLPGQSTQDPLLDQLEEERRRRRQTEDIAPPPTPIAAPTYVEPFSGYPQPGNPQPTPVSTIDQDRAEQDARDAEAKAQMLEARKADQEAAGVQPDGEMHPSRQDTDGGLKNPGTTATGVDAWDGMVQAASQAYGVPQNVIKAIMDIESKGDPSATSGVGAAGLMQVMPMHAKNGEDLYDPATNIEFGTRILAENYQRYGSWEKAAAAYFGAIDGDGNITNASDGNAGGYEYVDKFTTKAEAYAAAQQGIAPTYGPSLPGARPIDVANLRPSQLPESNPDLTVDEAYAACGPAAAIVFAAMMGRSPNLTEAVEMAKTIKAWDQGVGMYGMDAEVRLIQALGGQAKVAAFDPQTVQSEITNGNPVIVDAPGHYGVISGYDPASDRYYFGTSAADLKGGQPWMTLDEYQALNANKGSIRGMLLVDNPLGHGPSLATSQGGPSIPRTWSPSDSHKAALGEDVEGRVAQDELDAAHRLAEQVGNQVRKSQEDARRQTEAQVQPASPAQPYGAPQPQALSAEFPGNLDLLKPETPKVEPASPTTSPDRTPEFVEQAHQLDQQFPFGPGTQYKTKEDRDKDPNFELAAVKIARQMQEAAHPEVTVMDEQGHGAPSIPQPDGTLRPATGPEMQRAVETKIANQELQNREQYLTRQLETHKEEAEAQTDIWSMTPDEYTKWRRDQGLPIRPDEYQRHAIAVLDAVQHGDPVPKKVKDAYGSDVSERWQRDRRTALAPIEAVANGAPYDGDDANFRWQGIQHWQGYAGAVAQQAGNALGLAFSGMAQSGLQAADAGAEWIERQTGLQSSNTFGAAADQLKRATSAYPEMQSPDRPPEGLVEAFKYTADPTRPDRFVRNLASLAPYLAASATASAVIGPALAAAGLEGAALAAGTSLASSAAVTGLTGFGQFYDEAVHADPTKGEKPLSKDDAMVYAGGHALVQVGIEAMMGKTFGTTFGRAAEAALERSPVAKKVSELLARNWFSHALKEGLSESVLEEGPQQVAENLMAKISYDPGRNILEGVGQAMGSTFGPSAGHAAAPFIGSAHAEAGLAALHQGTAMDEQRREQMDRQVTNVASADTFAIEQMKVSAAYGKSVGWNQRQIDLAQFRAAQEIYRLGVSREIAAHGGSTEAVIADPQVQRGLLALNLAQETEKRLADRRGYEATQNSQRQAANLEQDLFRQGILEETPSDQTVDRIPVRAGALADRELTQSQDDAVYLPSQNSPEQWTREDVDRAFDEGVHPPQAAIERFYETQWKHGTQAAFEKFDPSHDSGNSLHGQAVYVSDNDTVTGSYAMGRDKTSTPEDSGPNVRRILIPKDLTFLKLEDVVPVDHPAMLALLESTKRIDRPAEQLRRPSQATVEAAREGQPISGYQLLDVLREVNGGKDGANHALANFGVDGIAHEGGHIMPIQDETGNDVIHNVKAIFPRSLDKIRNGFSGTRGGASASPIPRRTARVGEFEAPGRELGTYESIPAGLGVWPHIDEWPEQPTAADASVIMSGRRGVPASIMTTVANRGYTGGFVESSKTVLAEGGAGFRPAMQVLQSVADRVLGGKQPVRSDVTLGEIIAGAQGQLGWSARTRNVGLNPAELFHVAVVQTAADETQRKKDGLPPSTPAEQRQAIISRMAEQQVSVLLHEAMHYFGPEGETYEEQHGGDFEKLFKPIDTIFLNVNDGTLNDAQIKRITERYGFEDGQVRAIAAELDAMVKATISTLTETFSNARVEGQTDSLKLLNDDAREQRLLALSPEDRQRANTTPRNNRQPDNADVGGGPASPAVEGSGLVRDAIAGESGTGVPGGEGVLSRNTELEGADELRPPESAPAEPGPVGEPAESGAPAARPAQLTDPRPSGDLIRLITSNLDRVAKNQGDKILANPRARAVLDYAKQVAAGIRARHGAEIDQLDPRILRWSLDYRAAQAQDTLARAVLQELYGQNTDVSPNPPLEFFADTIARNIEANPDPEKTWKAGDVALLFGLHKQPRESSAVIGMLTASGHLDARGHEVDPSARPTPAESSTAPSVATPSAPPVTENPVPPVQRQETPSRPATAQERPAPTTPPTTARGVGKAETVALALEHLNDEAWLRTNVSVLAGGGRSTARRYGQGLADAVLVENDPVQTEHNRQVIISTLNDRMASISEDRKAADASGDAAEIARLQNQRAVTRAILTGFGALSRGYEVQPGVTETFPGRDGKPEERVITRWVTARSGVPMMAVRGIGYVATNAKTDEAREALTILGRFVARVPRTSFQDGAGNPISMSESVRLGFEVLYGKADVSNAQAMQDVEQLSKMLIGQMPNMDVTLPEMMGLLLQAHQLMVTEALTELKAAADFEKQNKVKQEDVFGDGDVLLGKGGTRKAEALKAMQDMYKVSTLLPSIKKLATTGGRILRIMQEAEGRLAGLANRVNYQDMDRSITGITNLLKQVQADLKKGGPAAVEQFAQRLRLIDSGSNDPAAVLGRAPVDQLIRAILEQDKGGALFILNQLAGNVNTYAELEKAFLGSDNPYAAGLPLKQQLAQLREGLALEASGIDLPIDHSEKAQELAHKFTADLISGAARRRTEGRAVGESGKSAEAEAKSKWRGTDRENYALELINRKIDRLNASEIERALKEIESGLMPDMDTFWSEHVRAPQTFVDEDGVEQTEAVPTRRDQRQRLWEKRNELLSWKRENDDKSLAYRRDHPNRAGATTDSEPKNLQQALGEAYRQEMLLDGQIAFLKKWITEVQDLTGVTELEGWLKEAEDDLVTQRQEMADVALDMQIALLPELTEAVERSVTRRDELEAKMDDKALESALVMHLGLAAQQKIDQQMLLEAFSNHDIGKVEKLLRDAMAEHYHQTYDERLDVEYWLNFVEQMEKEYGDSPNVSVQLKLQDMRDRAYQQLGALAEHPVHGDQMAQSLRSRLVRAIHGDAGSLVLGIQSALTAPGYRVDGERHPDYGDVQTLLDTGIIESLAGTQTDPGPLAIALDDRTNPQAFKDLNDALTEIEKQAGYGLGAAFKQAVLAAVDVSHARANILDLLPMVEANPTDSLLRYMVEVQLLGLKEKLGDHVTETWFRRRFGSVEISLRRQYERAIEKGSTRLEKAAEQAAESVNTYNTLVNYGLETEADARTATEGKAFKKSAMELVLERMEKQRADALRKQIVAVTTEYWAEPDAGSRQMLEDHQQALLSELRTVGAYTNEQGETVGVGPQLAAKLDDQILKRYFSEESRQGIRQQGWDQRAEIKALEQQIREIHGHLMQGHEDGVTEALQQELQDRIADLDAVGATETEDALKDMGHTAAERIVKELGLKEVRLEERDTVRKGRRAATEELRDLRQDAMTAVRAMAKDPQNPLLRQDLLDALDAMDQVGYTDYEDVQVTDTDPTNGGTIGKRTEHREIRREVGKTQADAIRALTLVRIGSTMDQLDTMSQRTDLDRPTEQSITAAIQDRVKALMGAARESDTGNRVGAEIQGLIDVLTRLGVAGQQAAKAEQAKLQSTGVARSMLRTDEDARAQTTTFFSMIADSTNPQNVARAMRLMTNPSWSTYYRELGVIFMLSSPTTWGWFGTSAIGQTLNVVLRSPLWVARATTAQLMGKRKAVYWSEAGAAARALGDMSLWKDSLKSAREIYAHGHSGLQMNKASGSGDLRDLNSEAFVEATIDKGGAWRALHELAVWGHRFSLRPLKMLDEITKNVVYAAAFEAQLERKVQQLNQIEKRTPGNEITRFDLLNDNKYIRDYGDVVKKAGFIQQSAVFQEKDPILGPINGWLHKAGSQRKGRNPLFDAADIVISTYVPFSTVPYNSLKQAAQMSGIGTLAYTGAALYQWNTGKGNVASAERRVAEEKKMPLEQLRLEDVDNLLGKRKAMAENEQISDFVSKAAFGATMQILGWVLASAGNLTGDEPEDPDDRAVNQEEKLPPRSIRLGGKWYSYDNTPFMVAFAISANIEQNWKKEWAKLQKGSPDERVGATGAIALAAGKGALGAVTHNFFLENLIQAASQALGQDKTSNADKVLYTAAAPWVTRHTPALLSYFASQGDKWNGYGMRDTRGETVGDRLSNVAANRMPFAIPHVVGKRSDLPEKVGILGQPVENVQPFGAGLVQYSKSQQDQFDQLFEVLNKYQIKKLSAPTELSEPARANGQFDITLPEQRIWQKTFGENLRREVTKTYVSPSFKTIYNVAPGQSPEDALKKSQHDLLDAAVGRARTAANMSVINTFGKTDREKSEVMNERIRKYRAAHAVTPSDAP